MKIYRHYNGGIYVEIARGYLESSLDRGDGTHQLMVMYQAIHNKVNYVRPAEEFDGPIVVDDDRGGKKHEKRFKHIGDTP
jgi:hypothetical protein